MTDSEKPEGDLEDADGVTVDADGDPEVDMESIELSEGDESSDED